MKASKYNITFENNNSIILYNTISRKYLEIDSKQYESLQSLLTNLDKNHFEFHEVEYIKSLIPNGMVVKDEVNELEKIEFLYNKAKYQDQYFELTIKPTLDCNFACTYCIQEHEKVFISDDIINRIIKFSEKITKEVKHFRVHWFGGEPLIEFDKICELTKEIKYICEKNKCNYSSDITTNGYLFNEDSIKKLKKLSVNSLQITLDGDEAWHNKKRVLTNGEGTFQIIKENIIAIAKMNIDVILRINIDKENYGHITALFDLFPDQIRDRITFSMCNLFQVRDKINLFDIYKKAIDKGYKYLDTRNTYKPCHLCIKNSLTIEPDGKLVPCSMAGELGYVYGNLDENGNVVMKNEDIFYKFINVSPFKNEKCKTCNKLPLCVGGCVLSRYKNINVCNRRVPDGMSVEEKAKLHYYSDLNYQRLKEENMV